MQRFVKALKVTFKPSKPTFFLSLVHLNICVACYIFWFLLQDLQLSGLTTVLTYYDDNWHPIREEWVECFKNMAFTLGERTNNRLESINAKVKSVCARYVLIPKLLVYVTNPSTCILIITPDDNK